MTPLKRYLLILLFMVIGIGFGIGFGAIFYVIRKKKDDQITMGGSIKNIIIPSIFFWVTIGILIIVKMEYCIPLQLFILSAIVLAGFLSAISTKKAWMFFLCFGIVVIELGLEALIRRFVEWINCTADQMKAKNAAKKAIEIAASVPIYNQNIKLQHVPAPKLPNNFPPASVPPLYNNNNSLQPSAPPFE